MKEIEGFIIKVVSDIFDTNSQIAVKLIVENNLSGTQIDEFKLQHQPHFILIYSKCISNYQEKQYLHQILGNKVIETTILYRGSEHGWTPEDFHSRCDNKGPTICLFKILNGDCIGGYTTTKWQSQ
jgi:hypothetical protein